MKRLASYIFITFLFIGCELISEDKSDDLIGGEPLVQLPYEKRSRPSTHYRKGDAPIGQRVIPKVVQMDVGQSLVYDKHLMHGVGQVEQGNRLVLISWYGHSIQ